MVVKNKIKNRVSFFDFKANIYVVLKVLESWWWRCKNGFYLKFVGINMYYEFAQVLSTCDLLFISDVIDSKISDAFISGQQFIVENSNVRPKQIDFEGFEDMIETIIMYMYYTFQ